MSEIELKDLEGEFQLRSPEVKNLQDYIKSRNTAILVIMFTDLKGFTALTEEKGDNFSNTLRKFHDETMTRVIETDNVGKIIKFIGDSVMAVFAEPTQAVDRAMAIQREFRDNIQTHPKLSEISVRIGLHMGQVAVDNSIQTDIFGRHVNRAARIEAIADGGQIFMTYPVFDSAKGWLAERPTLGWARHGNYELKGIADPIEVIEVYDSRYFKPVPPQKARKVSGLPPILALAGAFLLGVMLTLGVQWLSSSVLLPKPEVYVYGLFETDLALNDEYPVLIDPITAIESNRDYKLQHDLEPGTHALWFRDNFRVVLATFEVGYGENRINPEWETYRFPYLEHRFAFEEDGVYMTYEETLPLPLIKDDWTVEEDTITIKYRIKREQSEGADFQEGVGYADYSGDITIIHPKGTQVVPIEYQRDYSRGSDRTDKSVIMEEENYYSEYSIYTSRDFIELKTFTYFNLPWDRD
jgi:class 3 adenylate cyclase